MAFWQNWQVIESPKWPGWVATFWDTLVGAAEVGLQLLLF